jgi:hypothetical protein
VFGYINIPGLELAGIGISHWMISTAIQNIIMSDETHDDYVSLTDEIGYAMDYYLKSHTHNLSNEILGQIEKACYEYYNQAITYFSQFKPIEHVDTLPTQTGVAIVFKDPQ